MKDNKNVRVAVKATGHSNKNISWTAKKVRLWAHIALSLLKKYTERYYTFRKREWELPHLEYQELAADDPNFPGTKDENGDGYCFAIYGSSRPRRLTRKRQTGFSS